MKHTARVIVPDPIEFKPPHHMAWIKQTLEPGAKWYKMGECLVIVGRSDMGWHLSISHKTRYPLWDEIFHAWEFLCPGVAGAMIIPTGGEYVNISNNCFHVHEIEYDATDLHHIQKVKGV